MSQKEIITAEMKAKITLALRAQLDHQAVVELDLIAPDGDFPYRYESTYERALALGLAQLAQAVWDAPVLSLFDAEGARKKAMPGKAARVERLAQIFDFAKEMSSCSSVKQLEDLEARWKAEQLSSRA